MKLTFRGAAGVVTGSMHLLESGGQRILLDCGMYQGRRKEAEAINSTFPFDAGEIDAVLLSHAHIDHSGNLPFLVRMGFRGPIYATPATIDLCASMLRDTAHIAESDARFVNKKHPEDPPVQPHYTADDVEKALRLFRQLPYHAETRIPGEISATAFDAGHILGSASLLLQGPRGRLVFSGDVGRPGLPIIRDPERLPSADYLIVESTYGGRVHSQPGEAAEKLETIVKRTAANRGKLIVPAFAVGRTQQLVLILHQLMQAQRIPSIPMFVDSPLAVDVTEAFRRHPECFDEETAVFLKNGGDAFGFDRLQYIRDAEESKKLNGMAGPFIVISPSGMCEAGRILHHLRNGLGDARNTVLLTGYQAENTLGRKLKDGWHEVRIFGLPAQVRATVDSLDELSGHGDREELLHWMESIVKGARQVWAVHGEPEQAEALCAAVRGQFSVAALPAQRGQSSDLDI